MIRIAAFGLWTLLCVAFGALIPYGYQLAQEARIFRRIMRAIADV